MERRAERGEGEGEEEGKRRTNLFDRPVPKASLSGRRHVPVLFSAQGIPVLRIKKPQPKNLSGYLVNRLEQRQRRHDLRHRIEMELELARWEDRWDALVADEVGDEGGGEDADWGEWSWELRLARREINRLLDEERSRNTEMAGRMQALVDSEREVFAEERRERKRGKRRRKREVVEGGGSTIPQDWG